MSEQTIDRAEAEIQNDADVAEQPAVVADDLVEEVSIDGMCGVY